MAILLFSQTNARLHLIATVAVVALGYYFQISVNEWILITIAIAMVFSAELFNTAIERLADVIHPEYNPKIKTIKDLAAAGVLMTALGAAIIGIFLFGSRIIQVLPFN
jgi:diacylglycerol kinase